MAARDLQTDAEVRAALADPARYSSRPMGMLDTVLIGVDPPAHAPVRRLVGAALRASAVPDERMAALADGLLAPLVREGRAEAVTQLARPLAAAVIAEQLGIEPGRDEELLRYGDAVGRVADGEAPDDEVLGELELAVARWAGARRAEPTGDGMSVIVTGSRGQAQLRSGEVRSVLRLLVVAGIVTSARLSAGALLALAGDPALQARMRAAPQGVPRVIEEALRRDPPLRWVLREDTRDGAPVACHLDRANRDRAAHPDPDRFDCDRADSAHVTFGAGPHRCPGAGLARRQAKVLLQRTLAATSGLAVDGEPRWERDGHLQGPATVPLLLG